MKSILPPQLNWLNVPEAVKVSVDALDREVVQSRRDLVQIDQLLAHLQNRIEDLEEANDRLFDLLKIERDKTDLLRKQLSEMQAKLSLEAIMHQVKRLFRAEEIVPEEIRKALLRMEKNAPQLHTRVQALEQHCFQYKPQQQQHQRIAEAASLELKRLSL